MTESFKGWADLNVHYGPDVVPRSQRALEAVDEAVGLGLAAICLRSHAGSSVDLAQALDDVVGERLAVFGGITLNAPVGGLNPDAVDVALRTGGRMVALPTWDAEGEPSSPRRKVAPIALFDEARPAPGLIEVLELVADAGACLDLGPVRADQLLPVIGLARTAGVERIVVSHPFYPAQRYSDGLVRAAAEGGAMIEHCYMQFDPQYPGRGAVGALIAQIRAVGPSFVVLSSDSGKSSFPRLADCVRNFRSMLAEEFDERELQLMFANNPAWLLGCVT